MKKFLLIIALSLAGQFGLAMEKENNENKKFYEMVRWWANKMGNSAKQEKKVYIRLAGKQIILNLEEGCNINNIKEESCSSAGVECDEGAMCELSTKIVDLCETCNKKGIPIIDLNFKKSSEKIYYLTELQS